MHVTRSNLYVEKGQYDQAITSFKEGLDFAPKNEIVLRSFAWLLATCPIDEYRDAQKALEYAKKVVDNSKTKDGYNLSVLAAAYAESGDFQEAVKIQEEGIEEATAFLKSIGISSEKTIANYEKRLESYKAGKPWRMEPPKAE